MAKKITPSSSVSASLLSIENKVSDAVHRALIKHAGAVVEAARTALDTGHRSGRIYVDGGAEHQASAPGEPPARDTGTLAASIGIDDGDGSETASAKLSVHVAATAEYAAALELGTSAMAPRPFLAPALPAVRSDAVADIRKAVSAAIAKRR